MDGARLARTLSRMAHQIAERHPDIGETVLVGIRTRGLPLARRLAGFVREASGPSRASVPWTSPSTATISPRSRPIPEAGYRDPVSIDGRTVVLVDDVLYTGRTVRAALDELIDFGRPARIELAACWWTADTGSCPSTPTTWAAA